MKRSRRVSSANKSAQRTGIQKLFNFLRRSRVALTGLVVACTLFAFLLYQVALGDTNGNQLHILLLSGILIVFMFVTIHSLAVINSRLSLNAFKIDKVGARDNISGADRKAAKGDKSVDIELQTILKSINKLSQRVEQISDTTASGVSNYQLRADAEYIIQAFRDSAVSYENQLQATLRQLDYLLEAKKDD